MRDIPKVRIDFMAQLQRSPKKTRPKQAQSRQPGLESEMKPRPEAEVLTPQVEPKLKDRVALITGGDSGIGRAVAVAFADNGANVAISYLNEQQDAKETQRLVEAHGKKCLLFPGDIREEKYCISLVQETVRKFGRLDILVNNAAEQFPQKNLEDITTEQLERTFRTNIFSYFFVTKAALPFLKKGSCIINTTSVTAYRGSASLIDYSATKGAIVSFTRSLAHAVVKRGIRVNAIAPGPVWTPPYSSNLS